MKKNMVIGPILSAAILYTVIYCSLIGRVLSAFNYASIKYSSYIADEFTIQNSRDSSICSKYNSVHSYTSSYSNTVNCRCRTTNELFYAGSPNQAPRCSDEENGRLYGKCFIPELIV